MSRSPEPSEGDEAIPKGLVRLPRFPLIPFGASAHRNDTPSGHCEAQSAEAISKMGLPRWLLAPLGVSAHRNDTG